ncbi:MULTISPECIES: hypothetical protein [unclassified Nocardioides]|uniref:hypothetical protein n=1 Tax=unclassified Nocardioides TaxID=2615069 RepID=UPI0006F3562D|nr:MULTISPECIES: hypothetical protein [unclassified Nocardioides]KQY54429.1 hypothetical protein ASD30_17365 [Nocardioides sp. Root140]KQZ66303.1 hypothetical protein ASD66_22445 [Nocardioides sp. Root151]KRF19504.1 hypothetical protein ASH02_23325 [Nocardioides sp. Soil796]
MRSIRHTMLRRRTSYAVAAAALAMTSLSGTPTAQADDGDLHPDPFAYCPVGVVTNPDTGATTSTCIASVGRGGTFKLGSTVVTLTEGVNVQGGLGITPTGPAFVLANDGMTLSGPDQNVPGGVLGVAQLEGLLPGITDIKAVVHLAGTPTFKLGANLRMDLPVYVELKNNLLGPHCTIGAPDAPFVLHLTSGTTTPPEGVEPITGANGTVTAPDLGVTVLELKGQRLVDNTFAVPAATGCGPLGLLNGAVNAKSHLPAAAGVSEARLDGNAFIVGASQVDQVTGYVPGM